MGAWKAVEVLGSRLGTMWRTFPVTAIVWVDVMRRTLAPPIRGVVSETSALRGNSVEIASAAVTGVTLGMEGSSARCHRRDASGHLPSSQSGTESRRFAYDLERRGV